MRTEHATAVRLADYQPSAYAISTVDLEFQLHPTQTRVRSLLTLSARAQTAPGTPLVLDGDELKLISAAINGTALQADAYGASADQLIIHTPPSDAFTLEIETEINPTANTKLMGLYRTSGNYCTQCEAEGFRRITYFLDRPDVLAVYTVRVVGDKAANPVLLSNGNKVAEGFIGDGQHFAVWHDPWPKPAYLFALVAGDLDVVKDTFITQSGREVELGIYVEHGNGPRVPYAMDALKRCMRWDETAFGREYDLDVFNIVAVSDFNMGAMENKGLNVFNDKYVLADPDVATDQDYAGIEAVIAHEYFHNWTGNRITCRDWFQLCLKEGLTVFRDQEFSSDMRSRAVKRISDVRGLRAHQFAEDAGPLAHPVRPELYKEINNFYTATVYEKGAEVIRMLKTLIGADAFARGMTLYFDRHDGEATTIEVFLACFAEASGRDLAQFYLWYRQAGTPQVLAQDTYDPTSQTYTLTLGQAHKPSPNQADKKPMVFPIRFGLVGPEGGDLEFASASGAEIHDDVIVLSDAKHTITFHGVTARPRASLLRGFSAPVKLSFDLSSNDLIHLMQHDRDPFNRWQAASSLAMQQLVRLTQAARDGVEAEVDVRYLHALDQILTDETLDPAFRALVLSVPGDGDVARELGENIDPDAIRAAVASLKQAIGGHLAGALAHIVQLHQLTGRYSPEAAHAGRRSLVNLATDLWAAGGDLAEMDHVAGLYHAATNMTDRLAALTTLVHRDAPQAREALADFYTRFATVPLALDKWFMTQATIPLSMALDQVKQLTLDPAFTYSNPNRVRALITTFATANPSQFARGDGAGFRFVAETVIRLDDTNPQIAARMLSAFRSWRTYEDGRKAKARDALTLVLAKPNLSRDVRDIAERSLA